MSDHGKVIQDVRYTSDKEFVSCASDKTIKLWKTSSSDPVMTLKGHEGKVKCLEVVGDLIVSGGGFGDNSLKIWKKGKEDLVHTIENAHCGEIQTLCSSEERGFFVSGGSDGILRFWDTETYKSNGHISVSKHPIFHITFNCDESLILVAGGKDGVGELKAWNIKTQECHREFIGHGKTVYTCVMTKDDTHLVSGGFDSQIRFWDFEAGECLHTVSTGDIYHTPSSMLLIRDEFVLVGCGKDVFLFNLFGDLVNQFSIPDAGVGAMDVSPDFSHLVVGCRTNIRMWYIGDFIPTQVEKQTIESKDKAPSHENRARKMPLIVHLKDVTNGTLVNIGERV